VTTLIVETRDRVDRLDEALETLSARRVDGIITAATRDDDLRGGTIAAEHLLDLGHVRLVQLHGPDDIETFRERCQGFRQAAAAAGVVLDEPADHAAEPTVAEGRQLMHRLLEQSDEPPTAVFAHNDAMAIGAIEALTEHALRCPEDVSVIGYNDMPLVEYLNPTLSTVRMPTGEVGRVAVHTMLAALSDAHDSLASIALQPTLVARGSTAPPHASRPSSGDT
jgi:LacI family transcriptional regulator